MCTGSLKMNTEGDGVWRRRSLVLPYHNSFVVLKIMEPYTTDSLAHDCWAGATWNHSLYRCFMCTGIRSSYTLRTVSKGFVTEILAVSATSLFLVTWNKGSHDVVWFRCGSVNPLCLSPQSMLRCEQKVSFSLVSESINSRMEGIAGISTSPL